MASISAGEKCFENTAIQKASRTGGTAERGGLLRPARRARTARLQRATSAGPAAGLCRRWRTGTRWRPEAGQRGAGHGDRRDEKRSARACRPGSKCQGGGCRRGTGSDCRRVAGRGGGVLFWSTRSCAGRVPLEAGSGDLGGIRHRLQRRQRAGGGEAGGDDCRGGLTPFADGRAARNGEDSDRAAAGDDSARLDPRRKPGDDPDLQRGRPVETVGVAVVSPSVSSAASHGVRSGVVKTCGVGTVPFPRTF
jgi:hypothetical protein